jgi:hypothetical protein
MWLGFFSALSVSICILCVAVAIYSAQRAIHASESLAPRVRSVESRLESLRGSLDDVTTTLTDLANRVKMQRVRTAVNHGNGKSEGPDPYKDPEGWRKMMNAQIAANKFRSPT